MVAYYEGVIPHTYVDPVGIPTACAGETDKDIVMYKTFTAEQCIALLGASMTVHAQETAKCVKVPVKPHEAAAIVSWSYNVGSGAACGSTLMTKLNNGVPSDEWCSELKKWDKAGGRVLPGLTKRRNAEYRMCTTGKWEAK
jgi:lysozyme